jgi:hypothetical protein
MEIKIAELEEETKDEETKDIIPKKEPNSKKAKKRNPP